MDENKMNMNEWNKKIEKLLESFKQMFPDGCKNITASNCKQCLLDNKDDIMHNYLCEIIASQYKRQ